MNIQFETQWSRTWTYLDEDDNEVTVERPNTEVVGWYEKDGKKYGMHTVVFDDTSTEVGVDLVAHAKAYIERSLTEDKL